MLCTSHKLDALAAALLAARTEAQVEGAKAIRRFYWEQWPARPIGPIVWGRRRTGPCSSALRQIGLT